MTRIERIGSATLHLGDCAEIIREIEADLVLTDPPYGMATKTSTVRASRNYDRRVGRDASKDWGYNWDSIEGDDQPFDPSPLLAFKCAVLWGANHYADKLPPSPCWFSWDRKMGRASDSDITDCELAWTKGLPFKTVRAFRHMWAGFQRDSEVGERHLHPSQKPVALMAWCLAFFPNARRVLDPYMGSAPVGVAALRAGREYVGVECNPGHFDTACRRIEQAYRQPDLFVDAPVAATHSETPLL